MNLDEFELNLLAGDDYPINENFTVKHHTLKEIKDFGEDKYVSIINLFCSTPHDYMVFLDDLGIDFESIGNYELFAMLFYFHTKKSPHLFDEGINFLFGNYNFEAFETDGAIAIYDSNNQVALTKEIYDIISAFLKKINGISPVVTQYGHGALKKYEIQKQRKKNKKKKQQSFKSSLSPLITALIVESQGSVSFFNVFDMKLYQFFSQLEKEIRKTEYDNLMFSYYSGLIDKDAIGDKFDWMNKKE